MGYYRFTKAQAKEYFEQGGDIFISSGNSFNWKKTYVFANKKNFQTFEQAVAYFLKHTDIIRPSYFV